MTQVRESVEAPARPVLVQPWGVRQMAPFAKAIMAPAVASMELDPATQMTVYRDDAGNELPMGKHRKTYGATEDTTVTGGDGSRPNADEDKSQDSKEVD
jgi:putative ATP-grasp target RiPP